jgi:hypothetical protein
LVEIDVLGRVRCDDELAASLVRQSPFLTILVEGATAVHAETRFEALRLIIEAGVDNLAVTRRCHESDAALPFQDKDFKPAKRESAGDSKPDHARADNDGLGFEHS